jgi:hypothetical protein
MVTEPAEGRAPAASRASGESANVDAEWQREEASWRYAAADELQSYRDLWAESDE